MVTKINRYKVQSLDFIQEVLRVRVRNSQSYPVFYSRIQSDLLLSYEEYIKRKGNPESIQNLNLRKYVDNDTDVELRRKTLLNLYEVKTDNYITPILNDLRDEHNLLFCPFCGEEVKPSTLDHFLPKGKFPEYSICLDNLVPMCTKCQGSDAKGEKVLNANNSRIFMHPYFEDVEDFLVLTILEPYSSPSFILDFKEIKDRYLYEPYRVCRRVNILRDYPDDKIKIYP